jgi:hypothetical protein
MREPFSTRVIAFVCRLGELSVYGIAGAVIVAAVLLFLAS